MRDALRLRPDGPKYENYEFSLKKHKFEKIQMRKAISWVSTYELLQSGQFYYWFLFNSNNKNYENIGISNGEGMN